MEPGIKDELAAWIHPAMDGWIKLDGRYEESETFVPLLAGMLGTRLVVIRMGRNVLEAKIPAENHAGELRMLPRIQLDSNKDEHPFIIRRRQFPACLYFAMTVNKSQGQSFDMIRVD